MTIRLRRLAEINPTCVAFERAPLDTGVTFHPLETVWADQRAVRDRVRPKAEVATGFVRFEEGDILLPKTAPTFHHGRTMIATGLASGLGAGSTEMHVLRARPGVDPRFIAYVVRSATFIREGRTAYQGVAGLQRVPADFVAEWPVALLSGEDQRRVADFLDDQVALLDRAIHLRQHNMGLLAERGAERVRTAVLGLDEPEPHKPVSAPWIGSVPLSWSVEPVGWRFEVLLGKMLAPDRVMGDYLRPYLRNTNVQWDRIDTDDLLHMDFPPHERARYELLPGDLLVCEGGDVGRAAIWDGRIAEIYYQKALHRLRPRTATTSRWMFYVLQAATSVGIFTLDTGTTIAHLTGEQLRAHRVPFPPMDVEAAIVRRLHSAGSEEVAVKAAMRRDIELLGERKQALITAAVTGEFDVSTASARSRA